ncbi:MAG: hypothetical protein ACXWMC_09990 [Syntrophales bacterium]
MIIHGGIAVDEAHRHAQLFLRQVLHSDKKTATVATVTAPSFNVRVYLPPSTKVKVAYAEISTICNFKGLL